jgi:hypothetical protein
MSQGIEGLSLSRKSKILLGKGTEAIYKSPPEHGQGIVITQKGNKGQNFCKKAECAEVKKRTGEFFKNSC